MVMGQVKEVKVGVAKLCYFISNSKGTQRENFTDEMSTLINSWSETEVRMEPSPDPAKAGKHKRV